MTSASPTQRTLARLRSLGWTAGVVERWNHAGIRQDLFGFIDIIAISPWSCLVGEPQIFAIQATGSGGTSARLKKIKSECSDAARHWLKAGGRIQVWDWKRYKKRVDGDLRLIRELITEVVLEDLTNDG